MTTRHVALALVLTVVAATVGVGAASSPSATGGVATPTNATAPLGQSISTFMQANAAQTAGTVENGMWVATFANASNASAKRALVKSRVGELNGSLAELKAERRALRAAYKNGTINRTTYVARLSTVVGQLAAIGEGIEETGAHGEAVGVNRSRLDALRSQARNLSGAEVSRLARNLTGERGPPGPPGLFEAGPPGQSGERGPPNATNRTGGPKGNATGGPDDPDQSGEGQGPPTGNYQGQGQQTPTATATETDT